MNHRLHRVLCALASLCLVASFGSQSVAYGFFTGDLDGNRVIDHADAVLALSAAAGVLVLEPDQMTRADVDGDGKVSSSDARKILCARQFSAKRRNSLQTQD